MPPCAILLCALAGSPCASEDPAPPDEGPTWSGSISVGATTTTGNTETTTLASNLDAERRRERDRWTMAAFWSFAQETDDAGSTDVTQRTWGGNLEYDWFAAEKLYLLANTSAKRDDLADLQLRYVAGGGVGYQLREQDDLSLGGEIGISYVHEDLAGQGPQNFASARASTKAAFRLGESTRLEQTAEALEGLEEVEDFSGTLDTRLKVTMSEHLFLQLQHVMTYDNTPAAGAERLDNRFMLTLGWNL